MTPVRLGRRARRADDRPVARRRSDRERAHAPADRLRRRPRARAHDRVHPGQRAGRDWSASRCSTTARDAGDVGRRSTATRSPTRPTARRPIRLTSDLMLGIEGNRVARPPHAAGGRDALLRAVVGRRPATARARPRRRPTMLDRTAQLLARLARRRPLPRPPLARPPAALGARAEGAHLRADRRDGRRADDVAAGDAGRRAQLGLPLHVDARRDVHAVGRCTRSGSTGRPTTSCSSSPTSNRNGDGSLQIMYGIGGERDLTEQTLDHLTGYEGATAGADRQRRLRPAPERRLRRGARLRLPAHEASAAACRSGCGRCCEDQVERRDRRLGASPTRASGRRAASRSTTSPRS